MIETLDQIADENMNHFVDARRSLLSEPEKVLEKKGANAAQRRKASKFQLRHDELYLRVMRRQITLRELRTELVNYYIRRGKQQIDERFFSANATNE